jgi:hypothetical protein
MNPRIRTLANQAHEYALGVYDRRIATEGQANVLFYQIRDDRFAQLIVREYIGILEEEIKLVEGFKSTAVKADVIKCHTSKIYHFNKLIDKSKKHFGVEE